MYTEVFQEFRFEAAHRLAHLPESHPCHRLHGHSYRVRVCVAGPVDEATGFVVDFAAIQRAMAPVLEALDHRLLDEVPGLAPSTCEHLAAWIWRRIEAALPGLSRVEVWEGAHSGCAMTAARGR
ncbi:MAG: 6-carboxytetrahydropterin synthase QueD [Planctomycetes bacterium]|nr:6-carboxytetrahydropterin synthase QueD [Planctomycetota bacterium]